MRLSMLLLIAALLGEIQSASAQSRPATLGVRSTSIAGCFSSISLHYTSREQCMTTLSALGSLHPQPIFRACGPMRRSPRAAVAWVMARPRAIERGGRAPIMGSRGRSLCTLDSECGITFVVVDRGCVLQLNAGRAVS